MKLSLAEAEGKLHYLAKRVESGDEVIITRDGLDILKLVPVERQASVRERRRAGLERVLTLAKARGRPDDGPDAAHSQDFLYDAYGVPK